MSGNAPPKGIQWIMLAVMAIYSAFKYAVKSLFRR